jgi:glycosyltransferase involved in cell wall biosynthesis
VGLLPGGGIVTGRDRLQVALVSDSIYPYFRGGKEIRYHEVARRLADHADVTVYTMQWWDGPPSHASDGVRFRAVCGLRDLYRNGRRSLRQSIVFSLAALRLLGRRFDVIETDTVPYPQIFALKLVAVLRRRRLVVTWHEIWDREQWRAHLGRLGPVGAVLGRIAFLLPDDIVAVSPAAVPEIRRRARRSTRVHLAGGGIDLDALRSVPPAAAGPDVLFVGRLIEHKGAGLLLEALALLRADGHELDAVVVGRGPQAAELRAAAIRLGLGARVTFREDIASNDEVYGLMKASRVFAAPSTREGFGVAVLEALACAVPVVTTDHPENMARLLVESAGAGRVCAPEPAALADAIRLAVTDDARADERWLRSYDWDAVADRVLEAYR